MDDDSHNSYTSQPLLDRHTVDNQSGRANTRLDDNSGSNYKTIHSNHQLPNPQPHPGESQFRFRARHNSLWDIFDRIYYIKGNNNPANPENFLSMMNKYQPSITILQKRDWQELLLDPFSLDGDWSYFLVIDGSLNYLVKPDPETLTPSYLRKIRRILRKLERTSESRNYLLQLDFDPNIRHYQACWLTHNIIQYRSNTGRAVIIPKTMMHKIRQDLIIGSISRLNPPNVRIHSDTIGQTNPNPNIDDKSAKLPNGTQQKNYPRNLTAIHWSRYHSYSLFPPAFIPEIETHQSKLALIKDKFRQSYRTFTHHYVKHVNIPLIQLRYVIAILLIALGLWLGLRQFSGKRVILAIIIGLVVIIFIIPL